LEVAGSNSPRFDRNPSIEEPSATARKVASAAERCIMGGTRYQNRAAAHLVVSLTSDEGGCGA
jgi:hypothetical protein